MQGSTPSGRPPTGMLHSMGAAAVSAVAAVTPFRDSWGGSSLDARMREKLAAKEKRAEESRPGCRTVQASSPGKASAAICLPVCATHPATQLSNNSNTWKPLLKPWHEGEGCGDISRARHGAQYGAKYGARFGAQCGAKYGAKYGARFGAQYGAQYDAQYGAQFGAQYGPRYAAQ
eukprot:1160532-Pelagomonas_calceolata.AAC.13